MNELLSKKKLQEGKKETKKVVKKGRRKRSGLI